MFERFLRSALGAPLPGQEPGNAAPQPGPAGRAGETETVREIVARLEALPQDRARLLAGFAYVMSRAAQADLDISDAETRLMEAILADHGHLDQAQAVLVVEMAKLEARRRGATEDYLVTREFARIASPDEKLAVLHACFAVAAASGEISAEEASVVNEIARELDVDAHQLNAVRAEFVERFTAIQAQHRLTGGA